jgi:hypothetical protein
MELLPVGKMLEGDAIRMADGCSACGGTRGTADGLARHEACTLARLSESAAAPGQAPGISVIPSGGPPRPPVRGVSVPLPESHMDRMGQRTLPLYTFHFFSFTCYTYKYPETKNNHTYVLELY